MNNDEDRAKQGRGGVADKGAGGLSRREFAFATGAGAIGLAFGAGIAPRIAEAADNAIELKIGFASPRTGALAGFGECDTYLLALVRKALANGIENNGKRYSIRFIDVDTQSDPTRASQLARKLITEDQVDLMLATSTPEVVNPVSDACEAAAIPCLSTTVPWEAWYYARGAQEGRPSPFKWTYHFSMGSANFFKTFVSCWNGPIKTNKKVGIMYPNDADGNAMRRAILPQLSDLGFTIVDPGGYQNGTTDYSLQIAKFKEEKCEILNAWPIPPDFAVFWRQAAQQGYSRSVKIGHVVKTMLFPSQVEALGALGENMTTSTYWHPTFPYSSRILGLTSAKLAENYETDTGRQWNQQIGPSMSLLDAGVAALERCSDPKDKASVAAALSKLQMECMLGTIDFTKGPIPNVCPQPMIGCQWVKAKPGSKFKLDLNLVENTDDPKVPIGAQLQPYKV